MRACPFDPASRLRVLSMAILGSSSLCLVYRTTRCAAVVRWGSVASTRVLVLLAICSAAVGCASSVENNPAAVPTPSSPSISGAQVSPLEGEWMSGPIEAAEVRAVVLDAGFTRRDADEVLGETRIFEFTLRFEDGSYALLSSWDGKDVGQLEGGTYRLIENDRLRLGTGASGDVYLFEFDLQGERLTLVLLSTTETGTAEDKYKHSYYTTAFYTGHPFTKTA
jgi:hypothetical protein